MVKVSLVIGTRPEIIKTSPIISEWENKGTDFSILHTGQHYSPDMDRIFFDQLNLPQPKYNLGVGSGTHGKQTGQMLERIEEVLLKESPDLVVVQGDTNTTLAGSLAAVKLSIPVAHIEAGMRSFKADMPEEINRKIVDHISTLLFVTSDTPRRNLLREGLAEDRIFNFGNTQVDALRRNRAIALDKSKILSDLNLEANGYLVATVHRQENTSQPEILKDILLGLEAAAQATGLPVIFPIHPRTLNIINNHKVQVGPSVRFINPLGYLDFLKLMNGAAVIITDSGGVQEESCLLRVPCVTVRNETEWVETVELGANVLAGTHSESIQRSVVSMRGSKRNWMVPPDDCIVSSKIVDKMNDWLENFIKNKY